MPIGEPRRAARLVREEKYRPAHSPNQAPAPPPPVPRLTSAARPLPPPQPPGSPMAGAGFGQRPRSRILGEKRRRRKTEWGRLVACRGPAPEATPDPAASNASKPGMRRPSRFREPRTGPDGAKEGAQPSGARRLPARGSRSALPLAICILRGQTVPNPRIAPVPARLARQFGPNPPPVLRAFLTPCRLHGATPLQRVSPLACDRRLFKAAHRGARARLWLAWR
jgi:hypothetical protein